MQSILINLSVCASVYLQAYLWNRWTDRYEILYADPHVAVARSSSGGVARYAMYFRFYGMDDVTFGRNGRDAGKGWQNSASAINYVRDWGGV